MANLKGGTTIGGQLALNTSNGLALTGGTMKGNTFIPGVYFTRYGPNIDWGATLQIGGNGTLGISRTNLIASVVTTDGNLHIDAGSTKATYLNFYSGTGGTLFGNGAGVLSGASVNNAGDMVLKNKITLGTTGGILAGGGGYFTDYVTNGRTSLGALTAGNGYGIFFYQGSAGRDSVDSVDIVFNTTTSATSVMSVKTNGEVKISGTVFASFSGSGASLTSLNASNLASGTLPDARLTGAYTGITSFSAANILLSGNLGIGGAVPGGNLAGTTSLAIGDSDTGFRQNGDGNLQTWANNVLVSTSTSGSTAFNVNLSTTGNILIDRAGGGGLTIQCSGAGSAQITLTSNSTGGGDAIINSTLASGALVFNVGGGEKLRIAGVGGAATFTSSVTATGFFQSSDLRLKDIISREGDTVRFTWKDKRDELVHIGYVAQEVQENYPDQVKEYKEMLSINYIEVLVAKIQELENRLKKLE